MLIWTTMMGLVGFGIWQVYRRVQAESQAPIPAARATPIRLSDPKTQGGRISPVWQLHSNGCQCRYARSLSGKRLAIEDTVALVETGRSSQPCRCYYRPLRDQRKLSRRQHEDRRAALRFALDSNDRRGNGERRQHGQVWQHPLHRQ